MLSFKDFNVTHHRFKTSNGINVVLLKSPKMPVAYEVSFLAGSRYDLNDKDGTAHFLEHILMGGTKSFPTKDKLSMEIENLGGSLTAYTSADTLGFRISLGDPLDIEKSFSVFSEILNNSIFDEKFIETERNVILRESGKLRDSQTSFFKLITPKLLYSGTNLRRHNLGNAETIKSINKQDLLDFMNSHFTGENTSITIAGDIDEENLKFLIEKYINLPKGKRKKFETQIQGRRDKFVEFSFYDNENTEFYLYFKTVNNVHKDKTPLFILSQLLVANRTGILTKEIRYKRGFAYTLDVDSDADVDRGVFSFYTKVRKEDVQESIDIFVNEVKKIAKTGPSEEHLKFLKNRRLKSQKLCYETCASWVVAHSFKNTFFPDLTWTLEDSFREYENTTAEDIKRVANTYFNNDNWYLALSGPVDQEFVNTIQVKF